MSGMQPRACRMADVFAEPGVALADHIEHDHRQDDDEARQEDVFQAAPCRPAACAAFSEKESCLADLAESHLMTGLVHKEGGGHAGDLTENPKEILSGQQVRIVRLRGGDDVLRRPHLLVAQFAVRVSHIRHLRWWPFSRVWSTGLPYRSVEVKRLSSPADFAASFSSDCTAEGKPLRRLLPGMNCC